MQNRDNLIPIQNPQNNYQPYYQQPYQTAVEQQPIYQEQKYYVDTIIEENGLIHSANKLLTLITYIRHTGNHQNVPGLKAQIIEEVKLLERALNHYHYSTRMIISVRYCLCTAIDEAVLSCPWGTSSIWVQESLLSLFQKETYGGERFYLILEDMLRDPRANINFIEFAYYLLCLGFEGKLFGQENSAKRDAVRNRVFSVIRDVRKKPDRALSLDWHLKNTPRSSIDKKRKLKKMFYCCSIILVIFTSIYNYKTYQNASPVLQQLDNLARVSPITILSQVIKRPVIKRETN